MRKILLLLTIAAFVIAVLVVYAVHASRNRIDVAPGARREIEKATRR